MAQTGEIQLDKLKATYSIGDVHLVDRDKVDAADELRLWFEVCWGVGLTVLGVVLASPTWPMGIAAAAALGLGLFFLIRYAIKRYAIMKKN